MFTDHSLVNIVLRCYSVYKECARIWKEAQELSAMDGAAQPAESASGPGLLSESGFLRTDILAVAKACRSSESGRR